MWTFALLMLLLLLLLLRQRDRLPPGPYGLPILGYLPRLDPVNPHLTLTRLADKHGKIYSLKLGNVFTVVLSDAELIKEALASSLLNGRAPLYLTHGIMHGNGIICAEGEKWKEQRKFVVSTFRSLGMARFGENRKRMESNIRKGVEEFLAGVEKANGDVDTEHLLMHCLGNVVFQLVFGKTWKEDDETWKRLLGYQEEGTKLIGVAGPINFLPWLRFFPKYKKILKYLKDGIQDTHQLYLEILEEYRGKRGENQEPEHFLAAFDEEMRRRGDDPGNYTLEQFNYLMADLWGAGVDTTITTLRWFFLYIAVHKNYQEEIQEELDRVAGEREMDFSDTAELHILRACISETQRIRSVTPLGIPHGALEDTCIAGFRIPKGSMVVPLQWAVHMNPESYPMPDTFDPLRFLQEDGTYRKREGFLPFQLGKRVCLGEEYANMLLMSFAGGVLQRYHLSVRGATSLEGVVGITLTPRPHSIIFTPRTQD